MCLGPVHSTSSDISQTMFGKWLIFWLSKHLRNCFEGWLLDAIRDSRRSLNTSELLEEKPPDRVARTSSIQQKWVARGIRISWEKAKELLAHEQDGLALFPLWQVNNRVIIYSEYMAYFKQLYGKRVLMSILKMFTNDSDTRKYFCKTGSERKDCGMYITIFLFIQVVND